MLGLCVALAAGCSKEAQYIETVSPSDNPYLVQVDTFTATIVTSRPDSFITSSMPYAMIGYQVDPLMGSVYAEHALRYTLPNWEEISNKAAFDSLELVLKLNHAYAGDSSLPFRLRVDRLSQPLTNEKNQFYNNSTIAAEGGALGTFTQVLRPRATDSIRLLLSPAFGNELFQLLRSHGDAVTTVSKFQEYFRGLKLSSDSNTAGILLQFKDSIELRLHYHEPDVVNRPKTIVFQRDAAPHHFNFIRSNYSGTLLEPLNSGLEIGTTSTDNRFYLRESARLRARFNFPALKSVLQAAEFVRLMGAELEIRPVYNSAGIYPLPPTLRLYQQKTDGTLEGPLASNGTAQNGNLQTDDVYGKDTRYVFDVSSYIAGELAADNYSATQLVLQGGGGDSTLHRLVAGGTAATEYRSRLILSLLVYKK